MIIYFYDDFGRFSGQIDFDLSSPVPNSATFVAPPDVNTDWLFTNGVWVRAPEGTLPQLYNLPVVPDEVSNIQAFEAIRHFGVLPAVQAYMNGLDADDLVRVTWEKATVFKRSSSTLTAISTALGLTDAQIDAMFAYAATVQV